MIYDETASGNCTFGEIFTTDGRIAALGLDIVDDPGINILYNVSVTMPDSVYQQAPEAFEALADTIFAGLDNDTMAELNRQVSADGEDPRDGGRGVPHRAGPHLRMCDDWCQTPIVTRSIEGTTAGGRSSPRRVCGHP